MIEGILVGLGTALNPVNILFVFAGCLIGTFIGMLPGLGPMSAIALMIPVAASLEPATGIILMAAVYYGAIFGGSTSSILINAPGVASTVATSFDGYPMAKAGKAGKALAIAAYSSFSGGVIAAIFLLVAAPFLAAVSLSFHSADYFALMVLGLTAVAAFAGKGDVLKALLMTVIGLMLSTVGTDQTQGVPRFTLGLIDLTDGISFLLLVMATFALSEALIAILKPSGDNKRQEEMEASSNLGSMKVSGEEVREMAPVIGRSSVLGFIIGVLPGAGATIASFLAYGTEQRLAGPEKGKLFGKGSVRGLSAPETANNAAATGSFVPLLTLGIPGSGTTAIMLGALIGYGIQPGPRLYIDQPAVFWSVIVSMWIGNIVLLILNLPLIPYIAKVLAIPSRFLLPLILFFSLIGVYFVTFNTFDIQLMVLFGLVAVMLRFLDFPMAPMILGFILGGMMEENLRRALLINNDSWSFLWQRPLTFAILLIALFCLFAPMIWSNVQRLRKGADRAGEGG
ncbi:tripartite tricarboxylate transporter permease [Hoeflea prorocentri]|uniref:Tripartite tricarboxylate transporter permease n=1 Tax=Hoeflea prorocentri TaxID=1922333 RepID=A0A9X3UNZ8_9HYPH|nr:tripartite tricarboxylate transporter permease [Hoeflea prorocentri]MCY6382551.1 tripartite tricarboxylate transporter permease [Hoeflea prorocentri]MDA5400351.1 tripartite tricarboxylate transporter permease [Hoeflea prorocentri]